VTKRITSGAFEFLNRVLGLSGEGAQTTELDDGNVSEVLEISRLVQAALAVGESGGLFSSMLGTTHAAAGLINQSFDPYVPALRVGAFSRPLDFNDVDLWYLGSSVRVVSTSQSVDEVQLVLVPQAGEFQGIAFSIGTVDSMVLARWDATLGLTAPGLMMIDSLTGHNYQPLPYPMLWPRNVSMQLSTLVSGAGATVLRCQGLWAASRRGAKPSAI